ncbi:MAG: hypothetical protein PHQ05_13240 [Sterolibacterium sp.]|nr:hypothetical protein [Sterolibacterium sp.]
MSTTKSTVLLADVHISEMPSRVSYRGTQTALLAAGIVLPEWLEGLGRYARYIALNPEGGFLIIGEGRGRHISNAHRELGAVSIKQYPNGMMCVDKFRTAHEERLQLAKYAKKESDKSSFGKAATPCSQEQARDKYSYIIEGTIGALGEYMQAVAYVFTPTSLNRIHRAFEELRLAFADGSMVPVVPKYRTDGNVIHFPTIAERRTTQ